MAANIEEGARKAIKKKDNNIKLKDFLEKDLLKKLLILIFPSALSK